MEVDGSSPVGRAHLCAAPDNGWLITWLARHQNECELKLARYDENLEALQTWTICRLPAARSSGFPQVLAEGQRALVAFTDVAANRVRLVTVPLDREN